VEAAFQKRNKYRWHPGTEGGFEEDESRSSSEAIGLMV
jgi:hypothetical protein